MKRRPGVVTSARHESYKTCMQRAPARVHPGHITAGQRLRVHRGVNKVFRHVLRFER
jgi:hypothetical protein